MPHKDLEVRKAYQRQYKNRRWKEDAAFKANIQSWRKDKQRNYWLRHKYGITVDDYELMAKSQDFKCYFCKKDKDKLHVDHDHNTKRVRGLLCMNCNTALGRLDKVGIEEIIKYLKGE